MISGDEKFTERNTILYFLDLNTLCQKNKTCNCLWSYFHKIECTVRIINSSTCTLNDIILIVLNSQTVFPDFFFFLNTHIYP